MAGHFSWSLCTCAHRLDVADFMLSRSAFLSFCTVLFIASFENSVTKLSKLSPSACTFSWNLYRAKMVLFRHYICLESIIVCALNFCVLSSQCPSVVNVSAFLHCPQQEIAAMFLLERAFEHQLGVLSESPPCVRQVEGIPVHPGHRNTSGVHLLICVFHSIVINI